MEPGDILVDGGNEYVYSSPQALSILPVVTYRSCVAAGLAVDM